LLSFFARSVRYRRKSGREKTRANDLFIGENPENREEQRETLKI